MSGNLLVSYSLINYLPNPKVQAAISVREVRKFMRLIQDVVRSRAKRDSATCQWICGMTMTKELLLDANKILGMGKMQYDLTRRKSASPGGVFTGIHARGSSRIN